MVAGGLALTGFAVGLVVAMLSDGLDGVNAGVADKAVGGIVIAAMAWLVWRVTVYPCLELPESRLTVRQPFATWTAPWHAVGRPDALDGLRVPLAGHGIVKPWAFSSSMLADLTGDLAANKAVVRLNSLRQVAGRDARTVERHGAFGLASLGFACALGLATAALASLV